MKFGKCRRKNGFATIATLLGMLLVAAVLPVATNLVQQSQENRSKAVVPGDTGGGSTKCNTANYKDSCKNGYLTYCSSSNVKTKKCTHGYCRSSSACAECDKGSSSCSGNKKKYCSDGETKTQSCTCGCKDGECKSKDTFYYYNKTSDKCVTGSYCTVSACVDDRKTTCYSSKSLCTSNNTSKTTSSSSGQTAEQSPSCSSKKGHCTSIGSCLNSDIITGVSGCNQTLPICCKTLISATPIPPTPIPPTNTPIPKTSCSSTNCGNCANITDCNNQSECNWTYNGNYCQNKNQITSYNGLSCTSKEVGTYKCQNNIAYLCRNKGGSYSWVSEDCGMSKECTVSVGCVKKASAITSKVFNCGDYNEEECKKYPVSCHFHNQLCLPKEPSNNFCNGDDWCLSGYCDISTHKCAIRPTPTPIPPSCSSKNGSCTQIGSCLSTNIITGVTGCNQDRPICCLKDFAVIDDCLSQKGTCRSSCPEGEKLVVSNSCRPAICCVPNTSEVIDGVCNSEFNGKTLSSRPADAKACSKGSVYWTNPSGLNFQYSWECRGINKGKIVKCSAQKTCTLGSKRCSGKTIQTCVNKNGSIDWKDGITCSEDCDSNTFQCKAKCKFNGVSVTTDQMITTNVCSLGVPGNTLIKTGNLWTWTCGGESYAEVSCKVTDKYGDFGNDCQEDKDCSGGNKCVDNKCMKSGYCISTKITSTPQIWKGDICFNKTKYSCTNSGTNFWSFNQTECKYKCQNNKCVDGYICTNGWSEHYNSDNKLVDSTQCGQGCDSTTGRCKGESGSTFKCVKGGFLNKEDWSEEYDNKNKKINSTHCYEGGCNQTTGKCSTAKDASVKSIQYPICESKGGICFGNIATCRSEGGRIISDTDCNSPTVCCQIIDKTDGICIIPKITNNEIPSSDNLCLNGDFSFVSYENQKYSWQCLGSSNGGKTANCSVTISNPKTTCDQQPLGTQKCQTPYISLKCTSNGWEPVYCNEYPSGEYCLINKCERVSAPQKEGDNCLENTGEFSCPRDKNLTCLNHKCVSITKAEEVEKNKIKCIGTSYNLSTVYDSQTACPSGLSCNRRSGTCEIPEKITTKKKANDFCNTDAECLTGYCMPVTSEINAPQTCSDVTDREYVDKGNKSAAIIGGTVFAPYLAAAANEIGIAGVIKAVTKIGNVADAYEVISGSIACAKDPSSAACRNLQEDMASGSIGTGVFGDVVDDLRDAYRATKTAASAASAAKAAQKSFGTILATAEDGSQLFSVSGILIQGPASYDIFGRFGAVYYPDYPVTSLSLLKSKIVAASPAVPSSNLNEVQKLWQYSTGMSARDLELMSDYVAVEQAYLAKRSGMPDLQNMGGDVDLASAKIASYMDYNGIKVVKTQEELQTFDAQNGYNSVEYLTNRPRTTGFFHQVHPKTVFIRPGNQSPSILPHELLHQSQYEQYLEYKKSDPYFIQDSPEIKEFEAYIYSLPLDFNRQSSNENRLMNFNETLSNALNGIQYSVKSSYGDATPNYLK